MRKYNIIYSTLLIMLSIIQQITGMDQPKLPSRTVSKKWLQLQEEQSSMKAHKEQTPPAQTVTRTLSQKFTKPELEPIQGINEDWTPAQKTYFLQLLSWTQPSKSDKFEAKAPDCSTSCRRRANSKIYVQTSRSSCRCKP